MCSARFPVPHVLEKRLPAADALDLIAQFQGAIAIHDPLAHRQCGTTFGEARHEALRLLYFSIAWSHSPTSNRTKRPIFTYGKTRRLIKLVIVRISQP